MSEGIGIAAMAAMMLFFGGLGVATGLILWACGLPWHRVLTCGAAGAALGVAVTVIGLAMREEAPQEEGEEYDA